MTFERLYGQWLVRNLNVYLKSEGLKNTCKQYDEVAFKPLRGEPDEIAIVISGGNATKSNVCGLDQNILPLTVTVICKTDYSDGVRRAIVALQDEYNAKPLSTGTVQMKSAFTTPFVFDESDYPTKTATVKVSFISFSATVLYGRTAVVSPAFFKLDIGGVSYDINNVSSYQCAAMPSYDSVISAGSNRASQTMTVISNTWALTIVKVEGDKLQEVFEEELAAKGRLAKDLKLICNGEEIVVRTYQLLEGYENNTAVYTLTLGY
ncbi:MAG: hypothetical protein IJ308_04410 [Clostridia bacterium]|nr:hypothetical protein [Clostridia bacterium]